MAAIVIQVSLDGRGPGILLNDGRNRGGNITTMVRNNDTVQWKLVANSGITSLDGINDTSTDVFNPNPTLQRDGSWLGTVRSSPGKEEAYLVEYTFNGVKYNRDPKIQVNP